MNYPNPNEEFLAISIPTVVKRKFEEIPKECENQLSLDRNISYMKTCINCINNISYITRKITKKLKSESMMFEMVKTMEQNYFVPIKKISKKEVYSEIFLKFCADNFKNHEQYGVQIFLRLLSIRIYYESKKNLVSVSSENNYKQKYQNEIYTAMQNIRVSSKINQDFDEKSLLCEIIRAVLFKSKIPQFFEFLREFFEELEMEEYIDLVNQLKQKLEEKETAKRQANKNQFYLDVHTQNSKEYRQFRLTNSSYERQRTDPSPQESIHSLTPFGQENDRKQQRILNVIRKTNFSLSRFNSKQERVDQRNNTNSFDYQDQKFQNDLEIDEKRISKINFSKQVSSIGDQKKDDLSSLFQESETDERRMNKMNQSKNISSIKDFKKDDQSSKGIFEKDPSSQPKYRRTISQCINPKYKVQQEKTKPSQPLNKTVLQQRNIQPKIKEEEHYRPTKSQTQIEQNKISQLQFCLEVSEKLNNIQERKNINNKKVERSTSIVLAIDTPSQEMEDEIIITMDH